jgi:hypothetical protein
MERLTTALLGAAAIAAVATPALAASCEPTLFPQDLAAVQLSTVRAGRLPLFLDPPACGRATGICPSRAYLVQGDRVLAAQAAGARRCVAFVGAQRVTIGWVDAGGLAPAAEPRDGAPWIGAWVRRSGSATLRISRTRQGYRAELSAFARMADPANVHTGGASGALVVTGRTARLDSQADADCHVAFRRVGELMLVNDGATDDANSACGGIGVTFNGIYSRR